MDRRRFLTSVASVGFTSRVSFAASAQAMAAPAGTPIAASFTGLSYESAQLANPAFFSAQNRALIELFRGLSLSGNLRLGGGSSEFTTYSDVDPSGPPPFEVFGPDTSKTVKHGTTTTALALRNLRGFLDATGWNCLYGLNLGQGTVANAVAEAAAAQRILGPRLFAFQIGNEPDSFRNRYRPASYGPEDFLKEWNTFHDAIVAAVPNAHFAGPDISNKQAYMTAFAAQAHLHPDVILLTAHYYAMGPAGNPAATLDQLFEPEPKLATMHQHNLDELMAATRIAGLPFRMSEGNSCWDGGKPGVSDTLASALWCADISLRFAGYGWVGVNWHGGGNGFYTPIAGAPGTGFTRRPEYFGIQFAQRFVGWTMVPTQIAMPEHVSRYSFVQGRRSRIAVINKRDEPVTFTLDSRPRAALVLSGPAVDSKQASLLPMQVPHTVGQTVQPYTAVLYDL